MKDMSRLVHEASFQRLVNHASREINRWNEKHDELRTGEIGSLLAPESSDPDDVPINRDDAVEEEEIGLELHVEEFVALENEARSVVERTMMQ